ncbi:MAG: MAPEG family protein [Proteobacteria bacterium]|nr:MAPEG family protein [Pseudomonadota bacterium]
MLVQAILLPLFVQALLVIAIGVVMAKRRNDAFKAGTHYRDIALREPNWPKPALQAAYAYANQFEMPVLFYVAVIVAIVTRHADIVEVVLAWVFVVCRYLQAFIHITSNNVRYRAMWFGLSAIAVIVMWVWLAIQIFLVAPVAA